MKHYCSDKCKAISSVLLVTFCVLNVAFAGVIFFLTYVSISSFRVHGGANLPNLNIDFDSFSFYILCSIIQVLGLLVLGLLAA